MLHVEHICLGLWLRHAEVEDVHAKIVEQDASLGKAIDAILQLFSFDLDAAVLVEQQLDFFLVLQHLHHLPLQLPATLLQYLVANE